MAFWFSNDRKYETGKFQKYKTVAENVETVMPRAGNPNALDPSGPKVSCLVSPEPSDDELQFLAQMGINSLYGWITDEQSNVPFVKKLVERLKTYDMELDTLGNVSVGKNPHIILASKERDSEIQRFKDFLLVLKAAGINTSIFTWEPEGVINTHYAKVRGGAEGRAVDEKILEKVPSSREREYTEEELWKNLEYFLKKMIPWCEEQGIRLALHPNDPPVPRIAGVPCLIRNKAAYDRVYEIVNQSPALGMEFCCGCWLEGADRFGNLVAGLEEYTKRGKIVKVHLRNVTAPLPTFVETYLDDGYGDIYLLVRTLVRAGYKNTIILDHTPPFVAAAGPGAPTAFSLGYIKACVRAAQAELKWEKSKLQSKL